MFRRYIRDYDYTLLFLIVGLLAFGVIMIHSAAPRDVATYNFVGQQLFFATVGLVGMGVATFLDYRFLGAWSKAIYLGIIGLLGVVFVLGQVAFGAQRWLTLMNTQLQPSELAKLAVVIVVARFLADREGDLKAIIVSGLLTLIPMGLVLLQPNLSTTIVIGTIWLSIAIMAGLPLRWLAAMVVVLAILAPIAWPFVPDYQRDRVLIFQDPWKDPTGDGYNLIQSRIAIGGGGLLGQGYGEGTQNTLGYLRVRHTDFIFSVIAEELGFVGSTLLFALLMALFLRLLHAVGRAQDTFGRLIIVGVTGWLFFQSFVNLGVNLGMVPPTGVPLPLISYGGSNLVTTLVALGLVQSVLIRQRKFEFD